MWCPRVPFPSVFLSDAPVKRASFARIQSPGSQDFLRARLGCEDAQRELGREQTIVIPPGIGGRFWPLVFFRGGGFSKVTVQVEQREKPANGPTFQVRALDAQELALTREQAGDGGLSPTV